MIAPCPIDILTAAQAWHDAGARVVLITLVGIEGGSPRAPGHQMVVASDGRHLGSFSGGCIEAAIVAEALDVLASARARQVRYGVGSPYLDVRLPCGGGIDLLFTPDPDPSALAQVIASLQARTPASMAWGDGATGFLCRYAPPLRIVAFGQGDDLRALTRLGASFGALVEAWSPREEDLAALGAQAGGHLRSRSQPPAVALDPWSAAVFLFHDHDWEEALLPPALAQPAFYHGAIGSRRTHAARIAMLEAAQVPPGRIAMLRGHIGAIPATREPAMLALSILTEIAATYDARVKTEDHGSQPACLSIITAQ